jgi:hypothetical protein
LRSVGFWAVKANSGRSSSGAPKPIHVLINDEKQRATLSKPLCQNAGPRSKTLAL